MRFGSVLRSMIAVAGALGCLVVATTTAAQAPGVRQARFAEPFPAGTYTVINPGEGRPTQLDLAGFIGKRAVLLHYWVAGHQRSEEVFLELERLLADSGGGSLALVGVVTERPGREAPAIRKRCEELGIKSIVISDEGFRIGQMLSVSNVPNIAMLDKEGRLRLNSGVSLKQTVEYKLSLKDVIVRAAGTGQVGTHGDLPRYYPVTELVGEKCPDFQAPELQTGVMRRLYSLLEPDQVNVLLFWHVGCGHCRKTLPELNEWLKKDIGSFNVISAARIDGEEDKRKTRDFCKYQRFVFTTLADEQRSVADLFQVTATPTILIVRPDGTIDSVVLHGSIEAALEKAKQSLLKTSS